MDETVWWKLGDLVAEDFSSGRTGRLYVVAARFDRASCVLLNVRGEMTTRQNHTLKKVDLIHAIGSIGTLGVNGLVSAVFPLPVIVRYLPKVPCYTACVEDWFSQKQEVDHRMSTIELAGRGSSIKMSAAIEEWQRYEWQPYVERAEKSWVFKVEPVFVHVTGPHSPDAAVARAIAKWYRERGLPRPVWKVKRRGWSKIEEIGWRR